MSTPCIEVKISRISAGFVGPSVIKRLAIARRNWPLPQEGSRILGVGRWPAVSPSKRGMDSPREDSRQAFKTASTRASVSGGGV
jgi:hypothetical protein